MKTISRYLMTLALLITAATGAWATSDISRALLSVPNSWEKDQAVFLTAEELPGFKAVTEEEAANWVPTDEDIENGAYLIYGFDAEGNMLSYATLMGAPAIKVDPGKMPHNNMYGLTHGSILQVRFYYTSDVTLVGDKTEATFTMPAADATVEYELVRDLQDATNPVAFTGLPTTTTDPIIVKKGSDGKYQPAEELNIQLIDPLAAEDAQNIIAADGITVKVLVGNGGTPIEYDQENPITLEAFLADMKPGYYWIKAEATDENSPYDGTVYSSEFTVVEQYDLTVKPANDFSKKGLDAVTVGSESLTIDATTGEATKTGIAPETEVKVKAKRGYVIDKVEVKKEAAAGKTIVIGDMELTYADGDTWETIVSKNSDKIRTIGGGYIVQVEQPAPNQYKYIKVVLSNKVNPSDIIDPSKNYEWGTIEVYS